MFSTLRVVVINGIKHAWDNFARIGGVEKVAQDIR